MDYDKTNIAESYNRGRDHGPVMMRQWMNAIAGHLDESGVRSILDLGCGTGRFSQALAERFNASVTGLDPSRKMLAQALAGQHDPRVSYASACAEALPLRTDSVDLVFISMAFHHFNDPGLAAHECRRVLGNHGRLCLRTGTSDKIPQYPFVPFFPTSLPLLEQRLPSLAAQCEAFESASFRIVFSGVETQQIAANYSEYAEKLAVRADSILASLDDKDFDAGICAVRAQAAVTPDTPITEPIDFVVFQAV